MKKRRKKNKKKTATREHASCERRALDGRSFEESGGSAVGICVEFLVPGLGGSFHRAEEDTSSLLSLSLGICDLPSRPLLPQDRDVVTNPLPCLPQMACNSNGQVHSETASLSPPNSRRLTVIVISSFAPPHPYPSHYPRFFPLSDTSGRALPSLHHRSPSYPYSRSFMLPVLPVLPHPT
ncbi:hypothetical protein LZ32DRAFT_63139 [Colletotrichum eremochloae]|nr:hypothetical protein LZ32DRAFT_89045 [Colletotrichum eremochloae]KAK2007052.1 hypothetical protein LZ32DRAFT_63139 [Colletotrichum eremochloae]